MKGRWIKTVEQEQAPHLYDRFTHREIGVDDIINQHLSPIEVSDASDEAVENIPSEWHPFLSSNKKFAITFDVENVEQWYMDIFIVLD